MVLFQILILLSGFDLAHYRESFSEWQIKNLEVRLLLQVINKLVLV